MRRAPPPLWLDYQRPAPGRHQAGRLLLLVGLALAVPVFMEYSSTTDELAGVDQHISKLRRDAERRHLIARTAEPAGAAKAAALPASGERWEALLAALEKAGDESVTLLALTPGAKEVSIAGEAKDLAASLDYVKRLQSAPVFSEAHLAAYETLTAHPQHPVRFTLVAAWREGA